MATTAFVREIHSFTSMCKEQQQSPSPPDPQSSSESPKMAPHELHHPSSQHASSAMFEMTNHDSDKSCPEFTSSDSNDMAAVYPYSALQQMQAVYGSGAMLQPPSSSPDGNAVIPKCRFCDYVPVSDSDSKAHENVHFPFKCSTCAYVAKTEGRLKSHENKYHSPVPPSTWVGTQEGGVSGKRPTVASSLKIKKRPVRCKLCDNVSSDKCAYYEHLRKAHNEPKLLKCDRCPFATHYKHHLEYHLRNHYGSKPFSCSLCNYSCVNKSMLNSHKKSHSNVYQFRCAECSYATKYCHSLKMHLVKYEHSPGETLNPDGTPNTSAVIDVHGRRRGPKTKKKIDKRSNNKPLTSDAMDKALYPKYPSIPIPPPAVYLNPKVYNNFSGTVFYRPSVVDNSNCSLLPRQQPPQIPGSRCPYCDFYSDSGPVFTAHIMSHMRVDPKNFLFPFNYMEEEMMRMRMNSFKTDVGHGNYFAPKEGETPPPETPAKTTDGSASSPTNGDSSDAYSSPRSNPDAYSGWIQQTKAQPRFLDPESFALNLVRPKTSTPAAKTSIVHESYKPQSDTSSVLDLSVKSSSDRQRTDSSSPNTSQSSSNSSGANDQPVPPTRNRRKGKAFKLDCYLRDEEAVSDFMPSRSETEQVLEHPARGFEVPKTSQNSAVRSELPTNMQQKRKLDTSEDFVYKQFASSPPNEERNFRQPFLNSQSPQFAPSTSQNTANNAHALPSPTQSMTSPSPNSTTPSPDRSHHGQNARSPRLATEPAAAPDEDRPVPKVVIKIEPMDYDSKPDSNVKRCYYCDLIFGDQEMFAMHNRYHSEGDPFTCGMCGVNCYDRVTLYNHLLNTPHPNAEADITLVGVVKR